MRLAYAMLIQGGGSELDRGGAGDRSERRHAAALGPRRQAANDPRRAQPPAGPGQRGGAPPHRPRPPPDPRLVFGAQPLSRPDHLRGGGRSDGAGRGGGRAPPHHRRDHARRGRGTRPSRGNARHGDRQGDLGDDRKRRRVRPTALPLTAAAMCLMAVTGCGGRDDGGSGQLVVSAAASLQQAFTDYAHTAGIDAKQSFAGSDELAAQIRQGIKPDVYAAANTTLPDQLFEEGLVGKPVVFATNSLVLAVPDGAQITSIG